MSALPKWYPPFEDRLAEVTERLKKEWQVRDWRIRCEAGDCPILAAVPEWRDERGERSNNYFDCAGATIGLSERKAFTIVCAADNTEAWLSKYRYKSALLIRRSLFRRFNLPKELL